MTIGVAAKVRKWTNKPKVMQQKDQRLTEKTSMLACFSLVSIYSENLE